MNKRKQILRAYNIVVVIFLVLGVGYALSRFVHLEYVRNLVRDTPMKTQESGLIKMEDPETESKRYSSYIPYYG